MKVHRAISIVGVLAIVSVFMWPAARALFFGEVPTPDGQLTARVIAFVVVALAYAFAVSALLLLIDRLPPGRHKAAKLAIVLAIAFATALLVPFAAVLPVVGIRSLCFHTALCESQTLQYVPHALYLAGSYPISQVVWALVSLVAVFVAVAFRSPRLRRSEPARQ